MSVAITQLDIVMTFNMLMLPISFSQCITSLKVQVDKYHVLVEKQVNLTRKYPITDCRPIHGTARNRHKTQITT